MSVLASRRRRTLQRPFSGGGSQADLISHHRSGSHLSLPVAPVVWTV